MIRLVRPASSLAATGASPRRKITTLDDLRGEFPGWDAGKAAGAFWAFPLEDPEALQWGLTPAALAFAIREAGDTR